MKDYDDILSKCVVGLLFHQCQEMGLIVDSCTILTKEVLILSKNHLLVTLGLAVVLGLFFR